MSTHIVPGVLKEMGFEFRYPFMKSLEHWRSVSPQDFEPEGTYVNCPVACPRELSSDCRCSTSFT